MDVALVTAAALPGLYADDRYLLRALRDAGLKVEPVVWEDPNQDWSEPRLAVIRSTWDYAYRRDQFVAWADAAARRTTLWSSSRIVRWNTHKSYLCDLATRGVAAVPTKVLRAPSSVDLSRLLDEAGWENAILKAAVAQSGRYFMAVPRADRARGQAYLDRLLRHEDMLVQPFIESVPAAGELSVVLVDGVCTHAVRKRAAQGDLRVHDDYGGSVEPEAPSGAHVTIAQAAIAAVGEPVHYARVDLVDGPDGPLIMEFEIVEPELFFRFSQEAVDRFTGAVVRQLNGG